MKERKKGREGKGKKGEERDNDALLVLFKGEGQ